MGRGVSAASRGRWAIGAAVITVAVLAVAGCSSGSSSTPAPAGSSPAASGAATSAAAGSSAPAGAAADTAFYNGKTVTLIVPSKPGGGYDAWGRLMSIYMGKYLHATIKVSNVPPGNTIVGQNQLAASPGNGLIFGMVNLGTDTELKASGDKGLNFDPTTDIQYIGSVGGGVNGIYVHSDSPYKTIADMQKATEPITVAAQTNGTTSLEVRSILGAYGVKTKYITGYGSTADQAAGFLRGDGVAAAVNFSTILDSLKDGKVRAIVTSRLPDENNSGYEVMKDVPTIEQLISQSPPATAQGKEALEALQAVLSLGQTFAAPKSMAAGQVAALRAAMKWSLEQPDLIAAALKQGLDAGYVDPDTVSSTVNTMFKNAPALAPYVTEGG